MLEQLEEILLSLDILLMVVVPVEELVKLERQMAIPLAVVVLHRAPKLVVKKVLLDMVVVLVYHQANMVVQVEAQVQ